MRAQWAEDKNRPNSGCGHVCRAGGGAQRRKNVRTMNVERKVECEVERDVEL